LHHPELVDMIEGLLPEYFKNSQNREIFIAWQKVQDLPSLKENLDPVLWEQVESLTSLDVIDNKVEDKLANVILRLQEQYLRDQEEERATAFAAVAEDAGTGADLARLKEEGIEATTQLKQVFEQKAKGHRSRKGWT
jgi:hypothetical protein